MQSTDGSEQVSWQTPTWQHPDPAPLIVHVELPWQPHVPLVHVAVQEQQLAIQV